MWASCEPANERVLMPASGRCVRCTERREQLGPNALRHVDHGVDVGRDLVSFRRALTVVDFFAIEVDLEAALANRGERYGNFSVST